jgi:hypothetical protein
MIFQISKVNLKNTLSPLLNYNSLLFKFTYLCIDTHHDSNMEGADSNVYGHLNGLMKRTRAK